MTTVLEGAVRLGLVAVAGDTTPVRIRNVNTSAVMVTTVATPGGVVRDFGNVRVPGDAAGGVEVGLAFPHPAGSTTGRLLPTGAPVEREILIEVAAGLSNAEIAAKLFLAEATSRHTPAGC